MEKAVIKLNIQKTKGSGLITSWQIEGEKVEAVLDFIFLGSGGSLKIKRCFILGRGAITNLDSILKSRDITLPTKIYIVKVIVLPVIIYGCQSWM